MTDQLKRLTFKYWCNIFDVDELHFWMNFEMENNPSPHPDMYDLNAKEPHEAVKILLRIAKETYNFDPVSDEGIEIGKKVFQELGEHYLKREVTPQKLCHVIQHLDSNFLRFKIDQSEYPICWWGDLWNCCDWYDETWIHENSTHIDEELKKVLSDLKEEPKNF